MARLPDQTYRITRSYWSLPLIALQVTPEALQRLQADPDVAVIYADIPVPLPEYTVSADVEIPRELNRPAMADTVDLIGATDVWAKGYTGAGWYVAIIDSGIRRTHELFQGKNIVEACFSLAGHCPNNQTTMYGSGAAAHHSSTYDGYDHGTHVAGIAAGKKADGSLSGIARDADIIAINVFSRFSVSECGDSPCVMAYTSDSIAALEYIYSLRGEYAIGAANMSLGGGQYYGYCDTRPEKLLIDRLWAVNIPTAIATGNEGLCGTLGAPACVSTGIAVMASTKTDEETMFNNWHATVADLFAPGLAIRSAIGSSDSSYASWNGTSMATPHVAGGLTLMRQNHPGATPDELLTRIYNRLKVPIKDIWVYPLRPDFRRVLLA